MLSGIASTAYWMYAGLKYYAITGEGLIPSETAKDLIESDEISRVIDVRTNFEWSRGHYKGAEHIPASSITAKSLAVLSTNEGILVYCNTGQRARMATVKIRSLGFKKVYYIEDGYWSLN
jgi:rhodanese-related sulfurtransferase